MIGGRMSPGVLGAFATLFVLVQAGPLLRFPRESEDYLNSDFSNYTANEVCFSDQKVFQRGEEVPNAGPCEECRCEPPSIVCQMLKCPVNNNGCRTIQRPNHCCPDYNCECDYNGQLYNDGERIDLPEDPCQVCYCKGGDVMCTSITCYQRDDCEPKRVPGQCCPKYEDCPIRDMEASNTEDKNVQTRSPNKTMNSNPKKEMQPWLLTKSVPQTSSSLTIPKSGETTTDGGNVIIVSDWLVERKTTEDFNSKQTENPDFSSHQEPTTAQPQKQTQYIEKESGFEQNMQTVKPTSIDEVVFTRIDIPNRIQEEILDSLTTSASTDVVESEYSTSFVNLPEIKRNLKESSKNTTLNSPDKYSEESLIAANKTDKENSSSNSFNKEQGNESVTTMISTDLTGEHLSTKISKITKNAPIKVEPTKNTNTIETSTTEHVKANLTENHLNHSENKGSQQVRESTQNETLNIDSTTQQFNDFEGPNNLSQGVTVSHVQNRSSVEMTLERLFGLDEIPEDEESTKIISVSTEIYNSNTSQTSINFPMEVRNTIYTTFPEKTDQVFTVGDFKEGSLNNKPTTEIIKLEEMNQVANNGLVKTENISQLNKLLQTTETSYSDEETTTSFTSDFDINKLPKQSGRFEYESNEENKETTYLPETTTEIETSTLTVVSDPQKKNNEAIEHLQENLIQGTQEDKANYKTSIDTTTDSNTGSSGYTDPVTSNSSSTTQGIQFSTTSLLNKSNKIQEASSNNYLLKVNNFRGSTPTPYYVETTKNSFSDIEIILREDLNNSNVLDKSTSSQESNEQNEAALDLAFDNISSENKEVANHPPVLELNSHVPFLQIGGDGNSESTDTEYDQTTVINNTDNDENIIKAIQENKEPIKLIENENKSNTLFINSTNVETLADTKELSNVKVEEFTIPTIAVVPLTPGDLKMIAEYLISEKIKPLPSMNNSIYSPNQWLKGNLTSENNIASILSAANVSIGLMNETYMGRKLETFNKVNQSGRIEKFVKETAYKSNIVLDNKNLVTSKTDYLHDKSSDKQETFKTAIHSQDKINGGTKTDEHFTSEATSNGITTILPKKIDNGSEQALENIQNLSTERTYTETINYAGKKNTKSDTSLKNDKDLTRTAIPGSIITELNIISEQTTPFDDKNETTAIKNINEKVENLNTSKRHNLEKLEKTIYMGASLISRLPVPDEKSSDSSITNKTDNTVINKQTTEAFDDNVPNKATTAHSINKDLENLNKLKVDNLETREKKINQGTTQIISRLSVPTEKPHDFSSTKKIYNATSKMFINKPSSDGINS